LPETNPEETVGTWKSITLDLSIRQTGAISDVLADWLRETLQVAPAGPVEVETNAGGYDEAGHLSPDFQWVEKVALEFPHLQARVTYHLPQTREESIAPYRVLVRWGTTTRRAWVDVQRPGHWTVLED
jgi:hypothetical protein